MVQEPEVHPVEFESGRRRRGNEGAGPREDPGHPAQRVEEDPAADQRNGDPVQTMAQERARSAPFDQDRREEPGHREERRHPERMNEADQPPEPQVRLRVVVGPLAGRQRPGVAEGGVEDEPEQHHHRAQRIQRVDPRRGGRALRPGAVKSRSHRQRGPWRSDRCSRRRRRNPIPPGTAIGMERRPAVPLGAPHRPPPQAGMVRGPPDPRSVAQAPRPPLDVVARCEAARRESACPGGCAARSWSRNGKAHEPVHVSRGMFQNAVRGGGK